MAFSLDNFDKLSTAGIEGVRKIFAYTDTDETLATLAASAYFNDVDHFLTIGDSIFMRGSDGVGQYEITAVSPNVTMEAATDPGALSETLADGDVFIGNGSNIATARTLSGDATVSNTGVVTIANDAVTSAKVDATLLQHAVVSISAAEFNGMYAAPKLLVTAGGADTLITLHRAELLMTYVSAQYAAGGAVAIQYDSTANGAGVLASTTQADADFQDAVSTANAFEGGVVKQPFSTCVNKGLYLSNISGAFTTGDSTFELHIWYSVVPTV